MFVYAGMLLSSLLFACLYDYGDDLFAKRQHPQLWKNMAFGLSCVPPILVAAIRFRVGSDYGPVYWAGFLGAQINFNDPYIPKSYAVLSRILYVFSKDPVIVFAFSSFLIYFCIYLYIKRSEKKILLPILFFFIAGLYFDSLNAVRQYMAIAVWLCSYPYLQRRKLWPYLILACLAAFLHSTALLLLPMYILWQIKLTRKRFLFCGATVIIGTPFLCKALLFIITFIPKYNRYISYEPDPELAGTAFALLLTAAALVLYPCLMDHECSNFLLWSLLAYDAAIYLSYFFPQMGRVMIYFEIPVFVNLLPMLLGTLRGSKKVMATTVSALFLLSSTLYMHYFLGHSDVFPYRTVFSIRNKDIYMTASSAHDAFLRDDPPLEKPSN